MAYDKGFSDDLNVERKNEKMKKNGLWITIIIACLLIGAAGATETGAAPSPALSVTVTQVTTQSGAPAPETFVFQEIKLETLTTLPSLPALTAPAAAADQADQEAAPEEAAAQLEEVLAALPEATGALYVQLQDVAADKAEITDVIPQETVEAVTAVLPVESKVENLVVAEFIPLEVSGYSPEIGEVKASISLPGEYTPETPVVALVGVWNGEEMEWFVVELTNEEEGMQLNFTPELLEKMDSTETVLLILRDGEEIPAEEETI